ncbi:mediator of RNA polymerase II transcription subunit 28-like [Apis dorsata]|uniref:Mediator of RNA polymerase II transcription subunit 28 n=1 Tax=Apis mellifera TaxID=7460 RepID=A0A7M7G057_APIME|nr:mediator of RNA polymerase II transcription subunit 28 [Apis mellifera]XP_006609326.1 mediator of RNA polymerase II transcription subunit 28-like [Apis dorsata]KAG6795162.1 mediator of RNA polymerase II transcription subunit 28-like [Apis mellifera caucasica]KAG9428577.1 mediator of RNA polymerase II transcription subunit 28-like [Apis mellifera carnica]|eukprot:XP_001122387.2 mediator of RNA polymerase II transcription subunit 28 [Apis mellifera]
MATPTNGNGNLIDEFEEAFQQCLSILITKDEGLGNNGIGVSGGLTVDKEEARSEVEQVTLRFIDLARQMEAFFLQKRFLLSALKPELVVKEDINDLRVELARKEDLIKRHYDKITVWQNLLADLQGWAKSPAQGPAPNGLPNGTQSGQNQQSANGGGNTTMQQQQQILQHQQLQQQQQQLQHLQQHQMQQQLHQQQVQQGSGAPPTSGLQGVGVAVGQQGMFMTQGAVGVTGTRAGFPVAGVGSSTLQGPLAFLEKTTSNIGMPERRS